MLPMAMLAQPMEGKIEYDDVVELQIELPDDMKHLLAELPTENKTHMALLFNTDASIYTLSDKGAEPEPERETRDGVDVDVQRVVIGGSASRSTYTDLKSGDAVRAEDMMGKKFLVRLDAKELPWKVLDEQRDILGYTCMKAQAEEDGQTITAWFTPQIPLAIGPDGYGGLAGAILALHIPREDGDIRIAATEVDLKPLKKDIERPTKGQKVSEEEYDQIIEKRMQAMREMHGGDGEGNVIIRVETDED